MNDYIPEQPKIPSEFIEDPYFCEILLKNGLNLGRVICAHKSTYCKEHEGELIIFNANIITKKLGKIWYGDLNITLDFDKLKSVADSMQEDLYILMEGDARFGYENRPIETLLKLARAVIKCKKTTKNKNNGTDN